MQGERAARALRHELGLGIAPIDIWDVLRRRGVHVAVRDFGDQAGDGLYLWKGSEAGESLWLSSTPRCALHASVSRRLTSLDTTNFTVSRPRMC